MIRYEWIDIQADVNTLCDTIEKMLVGKEQSISSIVGISRGGLIPAVMISHHLNANLEPLKWQTRDQDQERDIDALWRILDKCKQDEVIIVVDEIADTGKTFNSIQYEVINFNKHSSFPVEVIYCTIVQRMLCVSGMTILSVNVIDSDDWVVFPWEHY